MFSKTFVLGQVYSEPEVKTTKKGVDFVYLRVRTTAGDKRANLFFCAWGKARDYVLALQIQPGDLVFIEAVLSSVWGTRGFTCMPHVVRLFRLGPAVIVPNVQEYFKGQDPLKESEDWEAFWMDED